MLKRPGSGPGSAWMSRWNQRVQELGGTPEQPAKGWASSRYAWVFYLLFFLLVFGTGRGISRSWRGEPMAEYESPTRIAGLPLVATGEYPRGIIAVGAFPLGVIAIGGLPVGLIAFGGLAAGGIAISGLALGILAIGGGAVGCWAFGGGAVGYYAFGGLAVGAHAYAGNGVALGYYEASGRQKERLFGG